MALQVKQINSHLVRQGDTLERLALRYMGAADEWLQLALLNQLDYPYLSDDTTFVKNIKATGSLTFTRTTGSTGDVVIGQGSSVNVPATANAPARYYTTDTAVTIPNGTNTASVAITAVAAGAASNAPGLTVTGLGFTVTNLASCSNPAPIIGGATLNVKVPGDNLLVYTDPAGSVTANGVNTEALTGNQDAFYKALLGTDLALGQDGDLTADSRGGLAVISGIPNLVAALKRRFDTSLGWYSYYPYYGSGLERAVGQRAEVFWLQWARLEAERTVRSDPRVSDVQNIEAKFAAGTLTLKLDILIIGQQTPQNVVLSFRPATGGV